jgi:protein gp37
MTKYARTSVVSQVYFYLSENHGHEARRRVQDVIDPVPSRGINEDAVRLYKGWPLPNVWLGVSVEDKITADARIALLLQTPAAIRFVSYEPALGPVDFSTFLSTIPSMGSDLHPHRRYEAERGLDWIIAGGESGPGARPPHPDWFRSVRDQCEAAGVAFFFKQWGEYGHKWDSSVPYMEKIGKKRAGALLDGREWKQFPK